MIECVPLDSFEKLMKVMGLEIATLKLLHKMSGIWSSSPWAFEFKSNPVTFTMVNVL